MPINANMIKTKLGSRSRGCESRTTTIKRPSLIPMYCLVLIFCEFKSDYTKHGNKPNANKSDFFAMAHFKKATSFMYSPF